MMEPPPLQAAHVSEVTRQAAACGVPPERLSVTYATYLQNFELAIRSSGFTVDDDVLRCLVDVALETGVDVTFSDAELQTRFHHALGSSPRVQAGVAEMREDARAELAREGLIEAMPVYDPTGSLERFAGQLEAFVGAREGSLLHAANGTLVVRATDPTQTSYEQFSRLMRALLAQPVEVPTMLTGEDASS